MKRTAMAAALGGLVLALSTLHLSASAAGPGAAPTVAAPVDFPVQTVVAGQTLVLNGTGNRYKAIFRVYEAGLYAASPVRSADEFFALAGPKRLHMVARRDIDAGELGRMLVKGLADANPRDQLARQLAGVAKVGEMFASRAQVRNGESFGFEYLPGIGTRLMVEGRVIGDPVPGPEFFAVVMRLWLGPTPIDARLRSALLGQTAAELAMTREH